MKPIALTRSTITLRPDPTRVLARPFNVAGRQRIIKLCAQVMALPEGHIQSLLKQVEVEFGERHVKMRDFLRRRFDEVAPFLRTRQELSEERGRLTHRSYATILSASPLLCSGTSWSLRNASSA